MRANFPSDVEYANINELDAIFEIEKKCFPGKIAYSKPLLKFLILSSESTCLVEKQDGIIRGFIIIAYTPGSLTCGIETIDVDPAYKKKGIGLKLLQAAEIDMKQKGMRWAQLEVSEGNETALKVYEKAGYEFKERIEGYYEFEHNGTRNAIRMFKPL